MRRITIWLMSTLSALVLLFSYSTSTNAKSSTSIVASSEGSVNESSGTASSSDTPTTSATDSSASAGSSSTDSASTDSSPSTDSSSTDSSTAPANTGVATTYDGDAVMTRWGLVQVQITVADGKITKSEVLQVPWDNHEDQQINSYAVPILNDEAVAAQSADIDMVSGATVTSNGYVQSLQSAIDQANL